MPFPPKNQSSEAQSGEGSVYINATSLISLRYEIQKNSKKVKKAKALQAGQYYSPFKGRGMEFDEVRQYQAGDDVRNLDWRVTARTGEPHTKMYREERERPILVWVDFQRSMYFGTRVRFKSVIAARLAALVAWDALSNGDRLGYLLFSESGHLEQRPQGGKWGVLHFIKCLSDATKQFDKEADTFEPLSKSPTIQALIRLRRVARPGSKLVLVSDFREIDESATTHLASLARHNDVVLVLVYDPLEARLPPPGLYRFSQESESVTVDTSNKNLCDTYSHRFSEHHNAIQSMCTKQGIHFISCKTDDDVNDIVNRGL